MIVFYDSVICHHKILFNFPVICIFESGIRRVPFGNCHKKIELAEHVQRQSNSGPEICIHSFLRKYYEIKLTKTLTCIFYKSDHKQSSS